MQGGDPSQADIISFVTAAMNPPTYPEPSEIFTWVSVGKWSGDIYQLGNRSVGPRWTHVATGEVVEWWQICEKGAPQLLTASPIEASS